MDLILLLLTVSAFPVACLGFVLWMGALEDSLPAGVARALREPDPPPILAVPVRRTAAAPAPGGWESAVAAQATREAAVEGLPVQRVPTALLPAAEPLAGT